METYFLSPSSSILPFIWILKSSDAFDFQHFRDSYYVQYNIAFFRWVFLLFFFCCCCWFFYFHIEIIRLGNCEWFAGLSKFFCGILNFVWAGAGCWMMVYLAIYVLFAIESDIDWSVKRRRKFVKIHRIILNIVGMTTHNHKYHVLSLDNHKQYYTDKRQAFCSEYKKSFLFNDNDVSIELSFHWQGPKWLSPCWVILYFGSHSMGLGFCEHGLLV